MNQSLIFENVFSPAVLFFCMGGLSVFLGINLDIPQPIPKLLSTYLLISIGFKGGVELIRSGMNASVIEILLLCLLMAVVVPIYAFPVLRRRFDGADAAAAVAPVRHRRRDRLESMVFT